MSVLAELKCQMCGHCFEHTIADPDEPRDINPFGPPVVCSKCRSPRLKILRIVKRLLTQSG